MLTLETASEQPPLLHGAELVHSNAGRHEYAFDSSSMNLIDLLEQAAEQGEVLDVETHRAPIDEVVADLYEHWQQTLPAPKA